MKLDLMLHDPEEEHDCFSDNSHYYNQIGMRNVHLGSYQRIDGSVVKGPGLSDFVKAKDPKLNAKMRAKLEATVQAMQEIRQRADTLKTYDRMIADGNKKR